MVFDFREVLKQKSVEKVNAIQSSALEIDEAYAFVKDAKSLYSADYLAMRNTHVSSLEVVVDTGFYDTGWIPDMTQDFTISFVTDKGVPPNSYNEYLIGVINNTEYLRFGKIANTSIETIAWTATGGTNYIKKSNAASMGESLNIIISFDSVLKQLTLSTNGVVASPFAYDVGIITGSFYIGQYNNNGTPAGNEIKVRDFSVYPRTFDAEDFKNATRAFNARWRSDIFAITSGYILDIKQVTADIANKVGIDQAEKIATQVDFLQTSLGSCTGLANRQIAVIGDSITHGAVTTQITTKTWANKLKKLINENVLSDNFGYETIAYSPTGWNSTLFHEVTSTGFSSTDSLNTWSLNGYDRYGSTNATMTFTVPKIGSQKFFSLGLIRKLVDGAYDISVNGVKVKSGTLIAGTVERPVNSANVPLTDSGNGSCTITMTVTSGTVGIAGVYYYADTNDTSVNIYAESGRKTRDINEYTVNTIMSNNKVVFWAMGHNDAGLTGTDLNKALHVLDWVQSYAISRGAFVVFCDFLWTHALDNPIRLKMKEVQSNIQRSLYIDVPLSLTDGGIMPTNTQIITELNQWVDGSHPNDGGHRTVFNQVRRNIGF